MKTQEVKKDKSNKKRFSLVAYIKETIAELKRVTWSTKKELLKEHRYSFSYNYFVYYFSMGIRYASIRSTSANNKIEKRRM